MAQDQREDDVELRCESCIAIGCECPKGYVGNAYQCDVCCYRFVLTAAKCMVHVVTCPQCEGSITLAD